MWGWSDSQREMDGEEKVCPRLRQLCPLHPLPPTIASTGGNAGLAAAYAARKLGIPATVVLPEGTSLQVVSRLQGDGAEVQLTGKVRAPGRVTQLEQAVSLYPSPHP